MVQLGHNSTFTDNPQWEKKKENAGYRGFLFFSLIYAELLFIKDI